MDVHWIPTPSVLNRDSVLPIKKKGTFVPWSCFSCFWSRFKVISSVYKLPQSEGNLPVAEAAQVAATPDSLLTPMVGPAAAAWVPQALELPEVGTDGHPWVKAIRELLVETSTSWDLRIFLNFVGSCISPAYWAISGESWSAIESHSENLEPVRASNYFARRPTQSTPPAAERPKNCWNHVAFCSCNADDTVPS